MTMQGTHSIPFVDSISAAASLGRIEAMVIDHSSMLPVLTNTLQFAADPDRSLVNFERFFENSDPEIFNVLEQNPRGIEILSTLFSASQFLTEILVKQPQSIHVLLDRQKLTLRKTIEQIQTEVDSALKSAKSDNEKKDVLRIYQQEELLRIGASDFLDLYDLRAVISQISRLAIAMIRTSLSLAIRQTGISDTGIVILAMGKLGGRELNYSSDIDLLFVSRDDSVNHIPLAQKLIDILASTTSRGFLYRVDMRLRPWGNDGPLVSTYEGYMNYLKSTARLWEKQALLKVRPVAGELSLGEEIREAAEPLIINLPPHELRSGVFAMKQKTEEYLSEKGRDWGEVKLGVGSIRDVEFVVQYLQLTNLRDCPQIRTRATLKALPRLRSAGLLSSNDSRILMDGYIFLRTIEHYLQMMDYRQTYTLPKEKAAITILAKKLGFSDGDSFIERYQEHCQAIRSIYLHHIGSEPLKNDQPPVVMEHISRMDTSYEKSFSQIEIERHTAMIHEIADNKPVVIETEKLDKTTWRVSIVGYDYPGELSIICGLFFVYGFDIQSGLVFTYEPLEQSHSSIDTRQKIVDVFTVKSVSSDQPAGNIWELYKQDLVTLLEMFQTGKRREARGNLAKRVGAAFHAIPSHSSPLLPIEIEIDNSVSQRYTVLRIDAPDTVGFLYEFTNALAFTRINISRMIVRSIGTRAQDVLYVTDENGKKIEDLEKQRELRAAIILIKHFTHLLPNSPNPETALLHFREFLFQLFQRPNWPDEIVSIERSEVLKALARVLGVSDFLWDDLLRIQYANLYPVVRDVDLLNSARSRPKLESELDQVIRSCSLGEIPYPDWRAALNAFKDRELFRIDMRHILGLTSEFWDFASELTDLAEIVISATMERCNSELLEKYGQAKKENGFPAGFSILALGKCGGRELGFASDIELMFVYNGIGRTSGPEFIDSSEYFEKLVHSIVTAIHARQEGIFQIDLRLRPYGNSGSMAVTLESFRRYFAPTGPAWAYERQALVKLRPIAGDPTLSAEICMLRNEYVYNGGPFDVTAMRAMRERQVRHLVTGGKFNAKYSPGGLVDLEYFIQGLQINFGSTNILVRETNIRAGMAALHEAGVLNESDYTTLRKAHTFLRWLIDSLRVVRGNAKDVTVPVYGSEEYAFLARRLRYENDIDRLRDDLQRYTTEVQEINQRLLE